MLFRKIILPLLLLLTISICTQAQNTSTIKTQINKLDSLDRVRIELQSNKIYTGIYISHDESKLIIENEDGIFGLRISKIATVSPVKSTDHRSDWFKNPNTSRLFFTPTGRMLPQGSGYYQNIYVFFSNIAYSVSDYLTLSVGGSMLPTIQLDEQLFFLSAKTGYSFNDQNHLAAGVSFPIHESIDGIPGVAYGVYTFGTNRYSVTTGVGQMFGEDISATAMMLGGEVRIARRFSMVSENFYLPRNSEAIISYGIRFMGEQMSVDLAFVKPALEEASIGFGIPYLDFVFNF